MINAVNANVSQCDYNFRGSSGLPDAATKPHKQKLFATQVPPGGLELNRTNQNAVK